MSNIDQWVAEKCGIQFFVSTGYFSNPANPDPNYVYAFHWTLQDARCREIVREKLKINTNHTTILKKEVVECTCETLFFSSARDTIAEAEINCITKLYEAEHE